MRSRVKVLGTGFALTAIVAVADFFTPPGLALPVLYVVPVIIASLSPRRKDTWGMAIMACALSWVACFHSWSDNPWTTPFNRSMATLAIAATAGFSAALRRSAENLVTAKASFREREHSSQMLIDAALDAVITMDDRGTIVEWNAQAEKIFGWAAVDVVGRPLADVLMPERFRDAHRKGVARFLATGEAHVLNQRLEMTGIRRNGEEFPVALNIVALYLDGAYRFTGFIRDLSSQKRLEALWRQTVESAPVAMLMANEQGKIELASAEAVQLFGYEPSELLGQSVDILVPQRFRDQHPEHRRGFLSAPSARRMGDGRELFGLRKDGSEFPVEIGLNPVRTPQGMYVLATVADIGVRKTMEAQRAWYEAELERSNQELQQFAYVASHDLQEPLRKVASCCQVLVDDYAQALDDTGREWLEFAISGAKRMRALVQDLLEYSRVGRHELPGTGTNAEAALKQALDNLAAAIEESFAQIEHGPLPSVAVNPRELVQLLQNLIGNAIKYRADRPPRIVVGAERNGAFWQFFVRDNGIGIAPEYFPRIFAIFQRLHTKEEYTGTGIGLAICKKIVEYRGGTIWVESEVGEGSTFYFTLPVSQHTEALHDRNMHAELAATY